MSKIVGLIIKNKPTEPKQERDIKQIKSVETKSENESSAKGE